MANIAFQLKDSDLYQNGKLFAVGDEDEVLLLRDLLTPKQEQTDSYDTLREGDELRLLAYGTYNRIVNNPEQYWWLISDRNQFFNPLAMDLITGDGDLVSSAGLEIVLPNVLKQQPEL